MASPVKVEQTLTLPPMKVEPLNIPSTSNNNKRNTSAKTPTRIPLPANLNTNTSSTTTTTTTTTPSLSTTSSSSASKSRILATKKSVLHESNSDDDRSNHHHPRVVATTTTTSSTRLKQQQQQLRKPKSSSTVSSSLSTTPRLQSSKSTKSTEEPMIVARTTSKTSILNSGSASTRTVSGGLTTVTGANPTITTSSMTSSNSTTKVGASVGKRKVSTLQERLQGLVDESKSWTTHMERTKVVVEGQTSEIVLRGRGTSTTTSTSFLDNKSTSTSLIDTNAAQQAPKIMMRVAMSPEAALKLYQFNLTNFEKQEMTSYENIYFVGHHAKKRPTTPSQPNCNFGYDDERGDYHIQIRDHLDYRYEVLEIMGKGSFGQVLKCFDHKTGQTVAIKMIRNKKRFHAQALVEVKILEQLIQWDPEDKCHNVRMMGHFMFRNHLCIAFECLSINLYEFIKSNGFQGFSMGLIRRYSG